MSAANEILVVDDDEVVGRSINRTLSEKGYRVHAALGGKEALDDFASHEYGMVFADIRMPGMDGLEVTARMKRMHPEVPVVIITGYGSEANEQRARELGVTSFLHKPLTPEMIIENVERALRERRETMEAIRQSALNLMAPVAATVPATAEAKESVAKNLAGFFAAPFIGLAYIVAFPFIGAWYIGKYGWKAIVSR